MYKLNEIIDILSKNREKLKELNRKMNILKQNTIDRKIRNFILKTELILVPTSIIVILLVSRNIISFDIIHNLFIPLSVLESSLWTLVSNKKNKKQDKKQVEILKELTMYEMGKEQIETKNKIITEVIENKKIKDLMFDSLSKDYNISIKKTEKDSKDKILTDTKYLDKAFSNIDKIIEKDIIYNKFYDCINKSSKLEKVGYTAVILACAVLFLYCIPYMTMENLNVNFFTLSTYFTLGFITGGILEIIKFKIQEKAFTSFKNVNMTEDEFETNQKEKQLLINNTKDVLLELVNEYEIIEKIKNVNEEGIVIISKEKKKSYEDEFEFKNNELVNHSYIPNNSRTLSLKPKKN